MRPARALPALLIPTLIAALGAGCTTPAVTPPSTLPATAAGAAVSTAAAQAAATEPLEAVLAKPLYRMHPVEAGRYIAWVHEAEPDLRKRIAAIGRKNLGQPYSLNLLGEFPYQVHDDLPMFSLDHSDCVVFAEHTYAMALSQSWDEFFWMLQRIRYRDGIVGVATRNHYTEMDWNVANRWLVTDVSAELAGPDGPAYTMTVDRARFLKTRHHTDASIPVETSRQAYVAKDRVAKDRVAKDRVAAIASRLREGDAVNVISTRNGEYWASHVGLVVLGPDGQRHFLHSSEPQVREERNRQEGKNGQKLAGFKFLRLNDDIVVPPMAPQPRPGRPAGA